jgi:L-ribulose-5-phosphate 4-epimerase
MTDEEIKGAYEKETGSVIIQTFNERKIDPLQVSAVIVANHGPFSWGTSCAKAVENAVVMEYVAEMAYIATKLNPEADLQQTLLDKHFLRKHGKNAYYGQK